MRNVFKKVSVTLAFMAVGYGMFLKYVDNGPAVNVEIMVSESTIAATDSLIFQLVDEPSEEPN